MRDVVVSQSIKYSIHRVFTAVFDFTFKSTKYRTTILLYFQLELSHSLGWQQTFFLVLVLMMMRYRENLLMFHVFCKR